MTLPVIVRSSAETDLVEGALFIAEDDPVAAQRFLDEAEKAFARLREPITSMCCACFTEPATLIGFSNDAHMPRLSPKCLHDTGRLP